MAVIAAAAAAGLAGLGLLGAQVLHRSGSAAASALTSDAPGVHVDLLMDGWSLTTLGGRTLTATWSTGQSSPVTFEPVTADDIAALQTSTPDLLTAVLAREITAATDLACTRSGCASGGSAVDPSQLLPGSSSPAATFLRNAGVSQPLVKARLFVPAQATSVTVSAAGYDSLTIPVASTRASASATPAPESSPASGPTNGFGAGRYLVSAGLGRIFIPQASWLGAHESRTSVTAAAAGVLPQGAVAQVQGATDLVAATGLAEPWPVAATWTPSQLTLATSPSQGCAADVLCFPGTAKVTQRAGAPTVTAVTTDDGSSGVVAVDDRTVSVDLPAPIRQVGIDGVLSGHADLRMVTATLFQGSGVVPVDGAGGTSLAAADTASYTPQEVLAHVRLGGRTWKVAG